MRNVLRDARIGLRLLRLNPGFTIVAVLTTAIGIGATTAIFSVIYVTFFEPLPYRNPDRLVMVWGQRQGERQLVSVAEFAEWRRQADGFEDLEAWGWRSSAVSFGGRAEQVQIAPATPRFLPMFGYGHPLALGRDFLEEEGTPGRDQVVILTHRIWRERFNRDPGVIGRTLRIDRKPYTIVGVLGPGPPDENLSQLWVPLALGSADLSSDPRPILVMGRLRDGVSLQEANATMQTVSRRVAQAFRDSRKDSVAIVQPFRNNFVSEDTQRGLWLLLAAVGFVLLIACANVANLLLARGTARRREMAVRAAVGASRHDIVRQMIVESLTLASAGGALGAFLAWSLIEIVVALMPPEMLPTEAQVRLSVPVLLFALAVSGVSGILFGAAPALRAGREDLNEVLQEAGRALPGGGNRLRHALVAVEFALALTLLAAGAVVTHHLYTLASRPLGFDPENVLTFSLALDRERFADADQIAAAYRQILDGLHAMPGVTAASASLGIPVRGPAGLMPFAIASQPPDSPDAAPVAGLNFVTPAYFQTFGIAVTRGRPFTAQDRAGSVRVAIVSEAFVARYLAGRDPLSERLVLPAPDLGTGRAGAPVEWYIVGVQADVRSARAGLDELPEIVLPLWQVPWPQAEFAVRSVVEPGGLRLGVSETIGSLDPDLPAANVRTMEEVIGESLVSERFSSVLFGAFAAIGLLLAAFGIYGVMSFVVAQRRHEIGLRMALGASRPQIVRGVVSEGMRTALLGAGLGLAGAFYATRGMRALIAGAGGMDATIVGWVMGTLLATAALACLVPALRAASVDPMAALRQE